MPRHVKSGNPFGLQRRFELDRIDIVVLDGIGRPHDFGLLQTRHRMNEFQLDFHGQAVAQPTGVYFLGIQAFRLQNNLMTVLVRESNDFILKGPLMIPL